MTERFETHARTVSLFTLLSRVTGLARDATLSRVFGAGALMDAFFFAFMIPNLFRRLFGEGALAAAFLPTYAQLDRDDPETARRLASLVVALLVASLGALTLVGEAALFVISHRAGHGNVAVWLMMITLPYMPMVCLVATLGAMLQVHGRFGPPAGAPIVLNLCLIAAAGGSAILLDRAVESQRLLHVGLTAGSVLVAGVLQLAWAFGALRGRDWWRRDLRLVATARAPFRRVLRRAGPMIVGLGVLQLNTFFDGLIASYPVTVGPTIFGHAYPLEEGAMTAVSFAQRLYQFPLAVFGLAVATAIFPQLAREAPDADGFTETVRRGLRMVVFIGLPASVGLILVREPLAAVILQGGAFEPEHTRRVGFVLLGYAPAVWAYSMVHVLTRAFYARDDSVTPVRVAMGMVALNLALNCTLIWTPLRESGLAWSTAICAILQVSLLLGLARRHVPHPASAALWASWSASAAITALMAGVVWVVRSFLPGEPERWSTALGALIVLVASGAAVVALAALVLRRPELGWVLGRSAEPRR